MQLAVERLTSEPTPFHYEEGSAWWSARMPPQPGVPRELAEPLLVSGRAYRGRGDEIALDGIAETALELECARCLERYRHAVREPFRMVLEPVGSRIPAEPEAAEALDRDGVCATDDLELAWYRGGEVKLDALCLEVLSLALPVKPLCRDDCAGLCARCGANLSTGPCGCAQEAPDSPFAVLATLRGGPAGGKQ